MLTGFYEAFTSDERVMFIIAVICSIVFIIQLVMMIIGFGADELDIDLDDDGLLDFFGLKLISFKSIVSSLGVFSWTYLACQSFMLTPRIIVSVLAGIITLVLVAYIMEKMSQLDTDGNIKIESSVGKEATVYITIPKNKSGMGKVNIVLSDRLVELDAMTECEDDIKTNSKVVVVSADNNILLVKKI